ncbi:MAG: Smr/MutS family protein [Gammaproteobacteria bacterium]
MNKMPKKTDISLEDKQVFRDALHDVKPLKPSKKHPATQSTDRGNKRLLAKSSQNSTNNGIETEDLELMDDYPTLSDCAELTIQREDRLFFNCSGLAQRQLRQLQRGELAIQAELDLHRMTVNQARTELQIFMAHAITQKLRCVRIIHGKGHSTGSRLPLLKNHVNHWLRQYAAVLAFCSAQPQHGGSGAVYVLLKRPRI